MINIGICDDVKTEIEIIKQQCGAFFKDGSIKHNFYTFQCGEDVLKYCQNMDNPRLDILFLDVEMPGINGIELKSLLLSNSKIWRIAFVTNNVEAVFSAFSLKTIGFINKPAEYSKVASILEQVLSDIEGNIVISFKAYNGKDISIQMEDIAYFKASGSYTEIYAYHNNQELICKGILSKKIGHIELELTKYGFIRVHKSYLVNLLNVEAVAKDIAFRDTKDIVPIGRMYKENTKKQYLLYAKDMIKKKL